jgi:hypothetical protein
MELDLLVGCGSLQPSAIEASCLAGAHIVWDGRLVVDAQLCSSDASVMGAGPGAKFSRWGGLIAVCAALAHLRSAQNGMLVLASVHRSRVACMTKDVVNLCSVTYTADTSRSSAMFVVTSRA